MLTSEQDSPSNLKKKNSVPSKTMKQNFLLIIALFFASVISLFSQNPPPQKNDEEPPAGKSYVYKHSGGKERKMEIYFPPNHDPAKDKVPGVILFHGGGWTSGSLATFRRDCHYLASRGLVAATANYRMLSKAERDELPQGESHKTVCVIDGKSAIRWFKQHADEFGIDTTRIITGGGSAGGHISLLATLNEDLNDPADPKDINPSVAAYILLNPAFHANDSRFPKINILKFLKRDIAPALVIYGTKDRWLKGARPVFAELKKIKNDTTELWFAKDQAHAFFNQEPWKTVTMIAIDRFLAQQGLLEGEPSLPAPTNGETLFAAEQKVQKTK